MTTEGLKDWLKQKIDVGQGIRVGSIDGNADQCVGVYPGKISGKQNIALGGKAQTMVQYGAVEILVHWSKSAVEAEKKAMDVWRLFWGWTAQQIAGTEVSWVDPGGGPIPLGPDSRGIQEWLIKLEYIYRLEA